MQFYLYVLYRPPMKQSETGKTSALPACRGSPRSPVSWVGREPGRPSRSCQSWCSRSLDSSQLSCMCNPLGSGWGVERERDNGAPGPKMTQHYLLQIKSDFRQTEALQQVLVGSVLRGGQRSQLTQSLSCSHREEHPPGQAGNRNWLKKKNKQPRWVISLTFCRSYSCLLCKSL